MKRVFSIIFTILFLIAFAGIVYVSAKYMYNKTQAEQAKQYALVSANNEANPLEIQRRELKHQLDILKHDTPEEDIPVGTIQLVFRTMDKMIYNDIFPLMQEKGMTGVMVLSNSDLPGIWGKVTMEQFQEMLDEGWTYCIQSNNQWGWRSNMENVLNQHKVEFPEIVYVEKDKYTLEMDEDMEGYAFVIHHGEEAQPLFVKKFEQEGVIHLGAKDWNYSGVREELRKMVADDSNVVFTIGLKGTDAYKSGGFNSLLEFLDGFKTEDEFKTMRVCTPQQALEFRQNRDKDYQERLDAWQAEIDEIQGQLDDLASQIGEIYTRWGVTQ